ncbi:MAG: GNAT family N-acetyltransferase [Gemmatimonadota bacterium]|nr:GNAT family N-acetyltransferase [Gemmatimonadota bacterium]
MARTPPDPIRLELRDGTPILVRPIVPDDRQRLRDGLERLSEHSRYRRFMSVLRELTEPQLAYLTDLDYENHMAWAAIDLSLPDQPGVGVARYIRRDDDATKAEVAVTVVDSHQGRGLGTLLLGVLSQTASENGIETYIAHVLAENAPMLRIFAELGGQAETDGEITRVEIPVPKDPRDLPNTPAGRAFRAIARRMHGSRAVPSPRGGMR